MSNQRTMNKQHANAENSDDNETGSTSSTDSDIFQIEHIVSHRKKSGKYQYRIRWVGYSEKEDTWEPESNLLGDAAKTILKEYKAKHGISDVDKKSASSLKYVEVPEEERKEGWLVDKDVEDRELRKLYVPDRILDNTEKALSALQDRSGRLTRAQMKELMPTTSKAQDEKEEEAAKPDASKKRPARKRRVITSDDSSSETPTDTDVVKHIACKQVSRKRAPPLSLKTAPKKAAKKKPEKKEKSAPPRKRPKTSVPPASKTTTPEPEPPKVDERNAEVQKVATAQKPEAPKVQVPEPEAPKVQVPKPEAPKSAPKVSTLAAVTKPAAATFKPEPKVSAPKVSAPKAPVSMVGADPKKPPARTFTSAMAGFKIPKRASPKAASRSPPKRAVATVHPTPAAQKKYDSEASNAMEYIRRTTASDKPVERVPKPAVIRPASDTIREKECQLPYTSYRLTATLNLPPSQLISYPALTIDVSTKVPEQITQTVFNEAALSNKIAIVRAALRNKSHGLDLNYADERGRTLLHRLADSHCDQQHTADEIIDCLVNEGASLTLADNEGRTPLHTAILSRRACHARKLIELGSPVNRADNHDASPLITALRSNNADLSKMLLRAGATFQSSSRKKLSGSQQKPVQDYQKSLQEFVNKARVRLMPEAKTVTYLSPLFQAPLFECPNLDFHVNYDPKKNSPPMHCPLVMFAIVDACEKIAVAWGESPLESVYMNGERLEKVDPRNDFLYLSPELRPQNNKLVIALDENKTRYSKKTLVVQVFSIDLGARPA